MAGRQEPLTVCPWRREQGRRERGEEGEGWGSQLDPHLVLAESKQHGATALMLNNNTDAKPSG